MEKTNFGHIMLYYFKKGKNAIEMQKKREKKYVQCMERVLWLTEYVKSSFQSFMLEISCWTMLHSQVNQLKLKAIKSRH